MKKKEGKFLSIAEIISDYSVLLRYIAIENNIDIDTAETFQLRPIGLLKGR